MLLKDFVGDRKILATPYQNGVMLIVRGENGAPDDRILLNSKKFSREDRTLIKSGQLDTFVSSRGHYTVAKSEGDFYFLVPPTRTIEIKPKWGDSSNQDQKPWWEKMFDDDEKGPEVPF